MGGGYIDVLVLLYLPKNKFLKFSQSAYNLVIWKSFQIKIFEGRKVKPHPTLLADNKA